MKCKTINRKLILYFNNELSDSQKKEIKKHLENCEDCYKLYSELEMTFNLIEKKEVLKPNPFLYTRISQKLIDIKSQKSLSIFSPVYKKILQPVLLSFVLVIGLFLGVKLGSINEIEQKEQLFVSHTTEFYFNDLDQERLEVLLLCE